MQLRDVIEALGRRLHGEEDDRREQAGWTVRRTGWFGLSRVYQDPRWAALAAERRSQAEEDPADSVPPSSAWAA